MKLPNTHLAIPAPSVPEVREEQVQQHMPQERAEMVIADVRQEGLGNGVVREYFLCAQAPIHEPLKLMRVYVFEHTRAVVALPAIIDNPYSDEWSVIQKFSFYAKGARLCRIHFI